MAGELIPLFVLDPYFFDPEAARELPHRMQFLCESLAELREAIGSLGSTLVIAPGTSTEVVPALAARWRVDRVFAHRWVEPFAQARDALVTRRLPCPFVLFDGATLAPPDALRTGGGTHFSVFTPFSRAFRAEVHVDRPRPLPPSLPPLPPDVTSSLSSIDVRPVPSLEDLGLHRNPRLQAGGETAGRKRLRTFLASRASDYAEGRDRMDHDGTSRLSADLKFGTVSARTVWRAAQATLSESSPDALTKFHNELLWREFTLALLAARPSLLTEPFRSDFAGFPWSSRDEAPQHWAAWVEGRTGYPIVDAAARQLLHEGYVHNRARMISASFLTKHLLVHYREGEAHYMKYLTDGDWAPNNAGWQWSAGCGADAQPYFRVFNPVLQGEKFDTTGGYVRAWVPELRALPARYIHQPWKAPPPVLRECGVALGTTYPHPIVDHAHARTRFLDLAAKILRPTGSS